MRTNRWSKIVVFFEFRWWGRTFAVSDDKKPIFAGKEWRGMGVRRLEKIAQIHTNYILIKLKIEFSVVCV